MSAAVPAPTTPAARARRQATVVAAIGAVIPTVLAAQGMTSLAVDDAARGRPRWAGHSATGSR